MELLNIPTKNIKVSNLQPKFKNGSVVKYTKEWVKDQKVPLESNEKFIIYSEPRWDSKKQMFIYNYEYDILEGHYGCAYENDLQLYIVNI